MKLRLGQYSLLHEQSEQYWEKIALLLDIYSIIQWFNMESL